MKVAVFTMTYNEAVFLPAWTLHYGQQFGRENLFVIDVGSNDGSTEDLKVSCLKLPRTYLEEDNRRHFVKNFHASLLSYYDIVIFCDTDEFLVADPKKYSGLDQMLKERQEEIIAGVGLNVLHMADIEKDLISAKPVLEQRSFVQFDSLYCKPLIGRRPIDWTAGFHSCKNQYTFCTDLYLFHLKAVDRRLFFDELEVKRQAGLSHEAINKGHGVQLLMEDQQLKNLYFPFDSQTDSTHINEDFDFRREVLNYVQAGFRGLDSSRGSVARVPERLRASLPTLNFR